MNDEKDMTKEIVKRALDDLTILMKRYSFMHPRLFLGTFISMIAAISETVKIPLNETREIFEDVLKIAEKSGKNS